jgi:hypothetical protein
MEPLSLPREEWMRMYRAISSAAMTKCDLRFGAVLAKWRRQLQPMNDLVADMQRTAQRQQRLLQEEHCLRDDSDAPVMQDTGYVIAPQHRAEHAEAIEKINDALRAFMREAETLTEMRMPWSYAPPELMAAEIDGLYPLFTGEPPDPPPAAKKK